MIAVGRPNVMPRRRSRWPWVCAVALGLASASGDLAQAKAGPCTWQASWASAQMTPSRESALPPEAITASTLRQVIRVSIGGRRIRVRLSNAFGRAPLRIDAASVGVSADNASARVVASTHKRLLFNGSSFVVIPPGSDWLSDPVDLPVSAFRDLAISLFIRSEPQGLTSHPGSRATSYHLSGDHVLDEDLPGAGRKDQWYWLSGLEVEACAAPNGVVILGDSITDGYGVKANRNERWTDFLAQRLNGKVAILNQGIGGNRVLADGLGPSAMSRLDRDVFSHPGVRHLVFLEGVNDLSGLARGKVFTPEQHRELVDQLIASYAQIAARSRALGIRTYGVTVLPFGSSSYVQADDALEADRQRINAWIRAPGNFDAVIDLDAVMRDPQQPRRMNPAYDNDGLHPSIAGYQAMAEAVPRDLFKAARR